MEEMELRLVDFKVEFGKTHDGEILLADEISPDTCRIWDKFSDTNFDKDVYRNDTGSPIETYQTFLNKLRILNNETIELHITLQPQVLDTQGQALNRAVHDLGYTQVNDIRVGKVLYMTVDEATDEAVDNIITTLSEKLFANTVIEEYSYKVIEEKENA